MTSRDLQVIGEHTVDASLLSPGGWVLDAGCRDFVFSRGMAERGCRIIALDADPSVLNPRIAGVDFRNVALATKAGTVGFVLSADPQARHVADEYSRGGMIAVPSLTIEQLAVALGVKLWDVIKLDIEGSEYGILRDWAGPIARQISVEFHEHVRPRAKALYDEILKRLGQWYEVVQHEKTARHCCAPNYWDSLFVLKEQL